MHFEETEKNFSLSMSGFGEMENPLKLIFPNQLILPFSVDKQKFTLVYLNRSS